MTKVIVNNELYLYMNNDLIYKRWLNRNYGMVFCDFGNFTAKDIENGRRD
jgi:hypothetical protein